MATPNQIIPKWSVLLGNTSPRLSPPKDAPYEFTTVETGLVAVEAERIAALVALGYVEDGYRVEATDNGYEATGGRTKARIEIRELALA